MGVWIETSNRNTIVIASRVTRKMIVGGTFIQDRNTIVIASRVTPCVGVWIETTYPLANHAEVEVTPCVGVWIETLHINSDLSALSVTPCVGVWIETAILLLIRIPFVSHPAWVCGLKHGR